MRQSKWLLVAAFLGTGLFVLACGKTKVRQQEVYLLYQDIYGVVEYEADNDYPPPANLDNFTDDNIMVTLYFGETIDIYRDGDVYGYSVTTDSNTENFWFPFVPSGTYWLNAEFTSLDSCFQAKTEKFYHADTSGTFYELRPKFIGLNKGCFYVGLSGLSDNDFVQVGPKSWVTRSVYDRYYKGREQSEDIFKP